MLFIIQVLISSPVIPRRYSASCNSPEFRVFSQHGSERHSVSSEDPFPPKAQEIQLEEDRLEKDLLDVATDLSLGTFSPLPLITFFQLE
jgi:hypothetical protein